MAKKRTVQGRLHIGREIALVRGRKGTQQVDLAKTIGMTPDKKELVKSSLTNWKASPFYLNKKAASMPSLPKNNRFAVFGFNKIGDEVFFFETNDEKEAWLKVNEMIDRHFHSGVEARLTDWTRMKNSLSNKILREWREAKRIDDKEWMRFLAKAWYEQDRISVTALYGENWYK